VPPTPSPHDQARQIQARIRDDPDWFCRTILQLTLWSKQREIIESVRDNPRTAVRSSHGVGKTLTAGATALWFMAAYPNESLVVTTAPTWRQVKDQLWKEIRHLQGRSGFFDGKMTETRLTFGEKWYAVGLSTNRAENFQGYHSPRLLFIVDEASGVDEQIYEAADGFQAYRTLLIGNPTQIGGRFHSAFFGQSAASWKRIGLSTFDTPAFTGEDVPPAVLASLPSREWLETMKAQYGTPDDAEQGSTSTTLLNPVYEIRVLGQFPSQASNAVIPVHLVEKAMEREYDLSDPEDTWPCVISCDPASFGEDMTAITIRRGLTIEDVRTVNGQDLMETARVLLELARDNNPHPLYGKPVIVIDEIGIGEGLVSYLRKQGEFRIVAYNAAKSPAEENKPKNQREGGLGGGYRNARSELWFEFCEEWLPKISLPNDEKLLAELCAPLYDFDLNGARVVEPKKETKKRLGRSPDRADAVMMAFCRPILAGMNVKAPSGPVTAGGSKWSGMGGGASGGSRWR